jgi:hypothetical protein
MSRGLRPVTEPVALPRKVLDISAEGISTEATLFMTSLAASFDEELQATTHEVLDLVSAVSGINCKAPLVVTFEDFSHKIFSGGDAVVLTRPERPSLQPGPCKRTRSLPEVCTG